MKININKKIDKFIEGLEGESLALFTIMVLILCTYSILYVVQILSSMFSNGNIQLKSSFISASGSIIVCFMTMGITIFTLKVNSKLSKRIKIDNKELDDKQDRKQHIEEISKNISLYLSIINKYFDTRRKCIENKIGENDIDIYEFNDDKTKALELRLLINIKLNEIEQAKELNDKLNDIYKYCCIEDNKYLIYSNKDNLEKDTEDIIKLTCEFRKIYLT